MGESTDSNYSISSTGLPVLENLCSFKERSCNRLSIIDSPFCALHTLGNSDLPYIQCTAKSDSFQCKNVVHKMLRTKYCTYHETVKLRNPTSRNYESTVFGLTSESRRGFNTETKMTSKNDEPRTLIESLYRNKENDAYYDNFSSDGESVDSEGSEDLLKHTGLFSTEEILNQAMNRWKKYLSLCTEALGKLRYEMVESHKEMSNYSTDGDSLAVLNSPRFHAELKAYQKFLKIPKQETVHANNATMQKFMTTYREMKPSATCQFTTLKSSSAKAPRCTEVAVPCTNYCLSHLLTKSETKGSKSNFDKLPTQVLFQRCGGGPALNCAEIVVKWHPQARCALHTGFEDALYDPIVSEHNKHVLHNVERNIAAEDLSFIKIENTSSDFSNK